MGLPSCSRTCAERDVTVIPQTGSLSSSTIFSGRSPSANALSVNSVPNPRVKDFFAVRSSSASDSLTIGRLARAADVGVETIRYYQDRHLLPVPPSDGAFRYYPLSLVERIRFIKRAQELGFSLEEIRELLELEDGADRVSIRRVAAERLSQIEAKLTDLKRLQRVLRGLLTECEHTKPGLPCPIIGTIRDAPERRRGAD